MTDGAHRSSRSRFPLEDGEQDGWTGVADGTELEAFFAAANAVSDDEEADKDEETEDDEPTGVLPKTKAKRLKDEKKELNAEIKRIKKQAK